MKRVPQELPLSDAATPAMGRTWIGTTMALAASHIGEDSTAMHKAIRLPAPSIYQIGSLQPMIRYCAFAAALLLAFAAPAWASDAEIIQLSPGVYMATVKNHAGIFGHATTTKKKAILAANEFAGKQGMAAVPVAMEYNRAGGPGQWPSAEYQFRLVPQDSTASVGLQHAPDVRIEVTGAAAPVPQVPPAAQADLYTELMKLDDLRKRGLLTDQEFETQKARLLTR